MLLGLTSILTSIRKLDTPLTETINSNSSRFFKSPGYTPDAARFAENHKQPFAVTELLSGSAPGVTNFTGAVLVIAGSHDFIFCNGFVHHQLLKNALHC